jgi:hypothetical protein
MNAIARSFDLPLLRLHDLQVSRLSDATAMKDVVDLSVKRLAEGY